MGINFLLWICRFFFVVIFGLLWEFVLLLVGFFLMKCFVVVLDFWGDIGNVIFFLWCFIGKELFEKDNMFEFLRVVCKEWEIEYYVWFECRNFG